MRVNIEIRVKIYLHFNLLGWVRAEVSIFIKTLDTVACVSFLTLTLVQPSVGKLSVHLALRVGVTGVGDVTTITDHRVAVLGVLAMEAMISSGALRSCLEARATLITTKGAPGTIISPLVIPVAGISPSGESIPGHWNSRTSLFVSLVLA